MGESEAAEKLAQAAQVLSHQDQAIQLRYLQTLTEIAAEKHSTVVFPFPIEMLKTFAAIGESMVTNAETNKALAATEDAS